MTSPAGEKMSSKMGKFCCDDCRYNPNGCTYCGRKAGVLVGSRVAGVVTTLSGKTYPAYRECISIENKHHKPEWSVYLATGQLLRGPQAVRSFRPA